jgi:hypothetical protein
MFDGLGATLPPPITSMLVVPPTFMANPRVSPVARGIGAIVPMVLAIGLKLNEFVVSMSVVVKSEAPPT